jgi:ankyrin repeat protein
MSHRFRWIFCQLEVLRNCFPSSVRRFLEELPESLDETYERVLREIKKPNRDHARRLLQCLVAAIQPLLVEELAEVLAVDFDDAEGIPKLKPNWRWENEEEAVLTSCSSLIAIIGTGDSRVVQFSHFSVKEFLTSSRLATSSQDILPYHITLHTAHTIMAQACLSSLLRLDDLIEDSGVKKPSPLIAYAAIYWVRHAQFEDVATRIKGMEDLFDPDKPYFAAWCQMHDIDTPLHYPSVFYQLTPFLVSGAKTPLYYAALCGFSNLVEQSIVKHPHDVGVICGNYRTPAVAALAGRYFELVEVLHRYGSSVDPRGESGNSTLHSATWYGDLEMVQVLLDYRVDINTKNDFGTTPLYFALEHDDPAVVQFLLDHGADPNIRLWDGSTPLHEVSASGGVEIARLLVEYGASVEVQDERGRTPLDVVSGERSDEMIKLLLEHRAK